MKKISLLIIFNFIIQTFSFGQTDIYDSIYVGNVWRKFNIHLPLVDLPAEKYKAFHDQIKQEKAEKESRLAGLRQKLSNSDFFINEAVDIARNLQYYWDFSDLETKLRLQKTVFPGGLLINRQTGVI